MTGRARRRKRQAGRRGVALDPTTFTRDFEALLTDADVEQLLLCVEAGAAGDAARALRHYRNGPHVAGCPHEHHLHELVDLGDEAPGWVYSRWTAGQAYRWMLVEQDPRVERAVLETIRTAHADADPDRPYGLDVREFTTRLAASDWVCEQLAVHEYGGLLDFLDVKAGPGLLRRADRVRAWAEAPMGGYRLEGVHRDRLQVTDLHSGAPLEALNLGALVDLDRGTSVLGRLVPVEAAPGLMFESRPLPVPHDVARRVPDLVAGEGPAAWTTALGDASRQGRLPPHFSHGRATTLSSDLVPESWGGGVGQDVDNALDVCRVALLAVEAVSERAAEAVAANVAAVLVDSAVWAAARERLAAPGHAAAWGMLAEWVPQPVRRRCLELARLGRLGAA